MDHHDDLLQPSLTESRPVPRLFSTRAQFLTAFFGGGLAALALGTANSCKLQRLGRDLPVVIGLAAAYVGYLYWLVATPSGAELVSQIGTRPTSVPVRAASLALFGLVYSLHRAPLRAGTITGQAQADPWVPAIVCIVAGGMFDWWFTHAFAGVR